MPVVDLLLQREVAHQPVDVAGLPLAVAVHPAHGLGVVTRVPGGVEHHHAVGADQVHAQTTSPAGSAEVDDQVFVGFRLDLRSDKVATKSLCAVRHLVDSRKTQAEVLDGSLNWLISRSLSDAVVLPSSPFGNTGNQGGLAVSPVSLCFELFF